MKNNDIIDSNNSIESRKLKQSSLSFIVGLIIIIILFLGVATTNLLLNQQQSLNPYSGAQEAPLTWAFEEKFDYGVPNSTPPSQDLLPRNFDYLATHRDHPSDPNSTEGVLFPADHDEDCTFDGTSKQHDVSSSHHSNGANPETSFYICNNHMMSSMGDVEGYSVSNFYPRQEFDFAGGGVLEFEASLNNNPGRSWWEVLIMPRPLSQLGAAHEWLPISETYPNKYILFDFDHQSGREIQVGNGQLPPEGNVVSEVQWYQWAYFYPNDPALTDRRIRRLNRIELKNNQIIWSVQKQDGTFDSFTVDVPGGLPFTRGIVMFKQHAYTPQKDGNMHLYTTHWDNIRFTGPKITPYEAFESSDVIQLAGNGSSEIGATASQTITIPRLGDNLVLMGQISEPQKGQVLLSINGAPNIIVEPTTKNSDEGDCYWPGWRTFRIPLTASQLRVGANTFKWTIGPRPACAIGQWWWDGFNVKSTEIQMDVVGGSTTPTPTTGVNTPTPFSTLAPTSTPVPPTPTRTPTPTPTPSGGVGGTQPTNTPVPTATPVPPTATAAPSATPVPPTATAAPTATPTPVPCSLTSASWSTSQASEGQMVTLNVTGNTSCNGRSISFVVRENDSIVEGLGDDDVTTNPLPATMSNGMATTSWTAEWQDDGLLGGDPEYFFNATSSNNSTVRSVDPLLTVVKSGGGTVVQSGNRIKYMEKDWFFSGANVPWYNWGCDFGCNANGGVLGNKTTLGTGFAKMKTANMHVARWWVFPGEPWQIIRDAGGAPSGLNNSIYADFDAALELAEQYDLYYNFVLFSAATHPPRSWFTDPAQRQKLAQVLSPLFARYKDNPRVMSWEIFNEPEFQVWNNEIDETSVVETGRILTDAVHNNSDALVTVGSAMLDGMAMWSNVNLDYYSPHWYDYMQPGNWCALCQTTAQARSTWPTIGNKPIVIGEAYIGSDVNPLERYNTFYNNGYAGVWGWSLFPDRTSDHMVIDQAASVSFAQGKTDFGPTSSGTVPTPTTPPSQPTATSVPPTPTPTPVPCSVSSASWSQAGPVVAGTQVGINVTTIGACAGKSVSFTVMENDSIIEGLGDDPVAISPQPVAIVNSHATTTWVTEYQEDGLAGLFDPDEYYVNVAVVGGTGFTRSSDPLLSVTKPVVDVPPPTATPVPPTSTPFLTPIPTDGPAITLTPTPTPVSGTAWVGQYYQYPKGSKTKGLNGTPILTRTDQEINFNWGLGSPASNISPDRFSARWTSNPYMSAGTYEFKTVSDDGIRVYLDGKLISGVSAWSNHASTTKVRNIVVPATGIHTIVVEYFENTGFALVQFSYRKL